MASYELFSCFDKRKSVINRTRDLLFPMNCSLLDDSPDLCSPNLSKLVLKGEGSSYSTLGLIIIVQIFAGIGNIAYYALTLSYIDNNTKKTNVATHIGYILAAKFFGILLGYQLAWLCLK